MDQIVRDFYRGDYTGFERSYLTNLHYTKAIDEIIRLGNELEGLLPDEGKELYTKYSEACSQLSNISCEEEYVLGYRAGARFMLAALSHDLTAYH